MRVTRAASPAVRRLLLVPVVLPAVIIFPLLDGLMGSWWGVLGVAAYVVGIVVWVQAPFRRRSPVGHGRPRHRAGPEGR